jgi:putative aldouronate transport system permease protein
MVSENKLLRSKGDKIFDAANIVLMLFLSVIFLYPFWHCVALSFGNDTYSRAMGLRIWPFGQFTLENYKIVTSNKLLLVGYRNTILRTVIGAFISVFVTYLAATTLARKNLPGGKLISYYFLITMFIGGGLIPTYLCIKQLNLLNTFTVLVLPTAISAYNVMIARNFIASLPVELEESATIDGAHPLRIIFQIMLPLSTPILSVLTLWSAVGHWNAWFDAMIYNSKPELVVVQNVLRSMIAIEVYGSIDKVNELAEATEEATKAAAIVFGTVPILCLYPFLQSGLTKGIMLGAVKG